LARLDKFRDQIVIPIEKANSYVRQFRYAIRTPKRFSRPGGLALPRWWPRVILVLALPLMFAAASAGAAEELLPPFGFRWNDSMPKVEAVLNGAKARIIDRGKKENREVWTVEGLVHPGLKRTLFTFKQGSLYGVELQYEYPDRTIEWYNERMGTIRRYFDAKFGTGKLVSRSRDTDSDVIQTLVGYQWMVGTTMLELFYFSAERGPNLYRTISVDYKAL